MAVWLVVRNASSPPHLQHTGHASSCVLYCAVLCCVGVLLQILVMGLLPRMMSINYSACLILLLILLQVVPRAVRLSYKFMSTGGGGLLESAWATFAFDLLLYLIAAHIVGSTWYLLSVQVRACWGPQGCLP